MYQVFFYTKRAMEALDTLEVLESLEREKTETVRYWLKRLADYAKEAAPPIRCCLCQSPISYDEVGDWNGEAFICAECTDEGWRLQDAD